MPVFVGQAFLLVRGAPSFGVTRESLPPTNARHSLLRLLAFLHAPAIGPIPFCSLRTRQLPSFRLPLPGLENHPLPQLADGVLDCDTLHSTDASFASPEVTPKSDKIDEGRF